MPEKYLQLKDKIIQEHKKSGKVEETFINQATKEVGGVVNPQQTIVVYSYWVNKVFKDEQ